MSGSGREARVSATLAGLPVAGVSVAGRETWFLFPTLGLALDMGRAPLRLPGGTVHTAHEAVSGWRKILSLHEELEGVRYDARVEALQPGETVAIRKDLAVTAFKADHRVPTIGFLASEQRNRLRDEWRGAAEDEIRAAAFRGERVAERVAIPLVAYSGDTAAGIFELAPKEVFRAKVLLLECSFVEERDRDRSKEWKHLHLAEIAERADLFQNEVLVLTHLTLRTTPEDIRKEMDRRLPASLRERTVAFLPG